MRPDLDAMTDAELAQWQYEHREELDEEEGEPVDVEISSNLTVTMSFRLPGSEADAIRQAAREAGMSLSAWIRQACAEALTEDDLSEQRAAIDSELAEAERQVAATQRRLAAARKQNRSRAATASRSTPGH
jgi:hypothetical protein